MLHQREVNVGNPLNEVVAWIPRATFESSSQAAHGFSDAPRSFLDSVVEAAQWSPRAELEEDPSRKQLIPYVILLGDRGVWTMFRKTEQTEARLHGKASFGVGGHVEERGDDFLDRGMRRELSEEVAIDDLSDVPLTFAGTINDDTNPVGSVHLGFVFVAHVGNREVAIRETDKMLGEWTTLDEVDGLADRLETWSALLLPHLGRWSN